MKLFEDNIKLIDKCIGILYNRKKTTFNGCNVYYDDVIQNCYIDVFKALKRYDEDKSKIEPFIYAITENSINDQIRNLNRNKRKINFMTSSMEDYYDLTSEDDINTNFEIAEIMNKCLTDKEIKVIRYLSEGYNTVEIGKIMGYTPPNIRVIRDKARLKIKEQM